MHYGKSQETYFTHMWDTDVKETNEQTRQTHTDTDNSAVVTTAAGQWWETVKGRGGQLHGDRRDPAWGGDRTCKDDILQNCASMYNT